MKTTHNHLLPQLLPPVLKADGIVLILQNGLGIKEEVADIVGEQRVKNCPYICTVRRGNSLWLPLS